MRAERKRAERRRKREADELVSESESSSNKEEELKDRPNTNSSSEESEPGTPSQPDLVEDPESLPAFRIRRSTIRSVSKSPTRPISRPKVKAFKTKAFRSGNDSQKRRSR